MGTQQGILVKRLFTERARVVVYVEAKDLNRLTAHARSAGKTLVEWARETLLGKVNHVEETPRVVRTKAVAQGEVSGDRRADKAVDSASPAKTRQVKTCRHGVPQGHHCWQCGGKAEVE